jgi:hypothetical protein
MVVAAAMSEEVLSFDWGTTIIGVLDVNTDIYTPYCGASRIDGVRRIASCCGTVVSFNGNLYDLPQMAKFLRIRCRLPPRAKAGFGGFILFGFVRRIFFRNFWTAADVGGARGEELHPP